MNTKYYNDIVNVSTDVDDNCINFIDSLNFRKNIYKCISILEEIEKLYDSKADIYPSFIGEHIKGKYETNKNANFIGDTIIFEFEEYDTKELYNDLKTQTQFKNLCEFEFDKEEELIKLIKL